MKTKHLLTSRLVMTCSILDKLRTLDLNIYTQTLPRCLIPTFSTLLPLTLLPLASPLAIPQPILLNS